jgi:anaerobic ribonucleoside-triphosphate reductase activating protein
MNISKEQVLKDLHRLHHLYSQENKIRLAGISETTQDSLSTGVIIWFKGCDAEPRCPGCHASDEVYDLNWDTGFSIGINDLTEYLEKFLDWVDYTVYSGGEPLLQKDAVKEIAKWSKSKGKLNWLYTWREFKNLEIWILDLFDVIKCGRYEQELRDDKLLFRGSSNQTLWRKTDNKWESWEP